MMCQQGEQMGNKMTNNIIITQESDNDVKTKIKKYLYDTQFTRKVSLLEFLTLKSNLIKILGAVFLIYEFELQGYFIQIFMAVAALIMYSYKRTHHKYDFKISQAANTSLYYYYYRIMLAYWKSRKDVAMNKSILAGFFFGVWDKKKKKSQNLTTSKTKQANIKQKEANVATEKNTEQKEISIEPKETNVVLEKTSTKPKETNVVTEKPIIKKAEKVSLSESIKNLIFSKKKGQK